MPVLQLKKQFSLWLDFKGAFKTCLMSIFHQENCTFCPVFTTSRNVSQISEFVAPSCGSRRTVDPGMSNNCISMSLNSSMTMKNSIDDSARQVLSAQRLRLIRPAKKLNLYIAGLFIITDNSSGTFSAIRPRSRAQNNGLGIMESASAETLRVLTGIARPLTELTPTSLSCKSRTHIVYALLGLVIGQPVVCILVH